MPALAPHAPDTDEIDTAATIEVQQSPWKLIGLALAAIALVGTCAFVVFGPPGASRPGSFGVLVSWFGLIFFGFAAVRVFWQVLTGCGRAILTVSPAGLHDTRVSARPIPWTAVRHFHTWSFNRQKILVVAIDPEVEKSIGLTRTAAWTRGPNRKLGADGLSVTTQGLKISYARLFNLACAYARAHGGGPALNSSKE